MTESTVREVSNETAREETIANYLQSHPDFFERYAHVLARLRLPDERGSATVSLVERQIAVLREKNRKLEERLKELLAVARANDQLSEKIHQLARRLVAARGAAPLLEALEVSLREDFGATHWLLVAMTRPDQDPFAGITSRHLKVTTPDAAELRTFETLFESARPRCGQIRDTQRDYLFGIDAGEIASVALVPVGPGARLGLLAIGSPESSRFHPGMSTDFLAQIGDLIGAALAAL
jgi:uncharacterized protein YigA (DUF484 family)